MRRKRSRGEAQDDTNTVNIGDAAGSIYIHDTRNPQDSLLSCYVHSLFSHLFAVSFRHLTLTDAAFTLTHSLDYK